MFKRNKNKHKKGFSLVEIVIIISIMSIFLAALTPSLITNVEKSRAQKDVSSMDEVVNAVEMALTEDDIIKEMKRYSCDNNYVTYTDSSGLYGKTSTDEEFWAPDGSGRATTITFNPQRVGFKTLYTMDTAIVNDMTYNNGSQGEERTMTGAEIENNQCYLKNATSKDDETTSYLYHKLMQIIGNNIDLSSQAYKNSSYTIFIVWKQTNGTITPTVHGSFNGTNLSEAASVSKGSGTSRYDNDGAPVVDPSVDKGGVYNTKPKFDQSSLSGGGSISVTPDYKKKPTNSDDGYNHDDPALHPNDGSTPTDGDVYLFGDYKYTYRASKNGWIVGINTDIKDKNQESYGPILESINGKPIVNMSDTFNGCTNLTTAPEIPSGVVNLFYTFFKCTNLTIAPEIPSGVTNMQGTFMNCTSLTTAPTVIPNSVTNMSRTFYKCTNLTTAPDMSNASSVTDMGLTFFNCTNLTGTITINANPTNYNTCFNNVNFEAQNITLAGSAPDEKLDALGATGLNYCAECNGWCKGCGPTIDPALNPDDGSIPTNGQIYTYGNYEYKYNCYWNGSSWISASSPSGWGVRCVNNITAPGPILESINGKPIVYMCRTFEYCTNLTSAPAIPSNVINMDRTFWYCTNLTTAPTIPSNVINMDRTFARCYALAAAPMIPSSVTNMESTFYYCTNLTTAPTIPASVTNMCGTFADCTSLTTAPDMSNANSVTDMSNAFDGCTSLTIAPEIPSSVTIMTQTFQNCTNLTTAPVIPSNVTDMHFTFFGCTSLTGTITINANPTGYTNCFYGTKLPIALTGDCDKLAALAATANNGNVTVK